MLSLFGIVLINLRFFVLFLLMLAGIASPPPTPPNKGVALPKKGAALPNNDAALPNKGAALPNKGAALPKFRRNPETGIRKVRATRRRNRTPPQPKPDGQI